MEKQFYAHFLNFIRKVLVYQQLPEFLEEIAYNLPAIALALGASQFPFEILTI